MAQNKKSGHDRKRWRITFKLPIVHHQHTQRPMALSTDEFSFISYGYAAGVAVQRAWQQLRAVPELKGAIIRDCFITVKCLGYFTKADEGLDALESYQLEPEPKMSPYRTGPLQQTCPKCGKVFDFPEMTAVARCPHCGELQGPQ